MSIALIGAAIGLGAQNPASAAGPDFLQQSALINQLSHIEWLKTVYPDMSIKEKIPQIIDFLSRLAHVTEQSVKEDKFPLIIGGDHSCAIGSWGGVMRTLGDKDMGLIWVDAHLDSHTYDTSPSQAIHGMPLAVLLGHGGQNLLGISQGRIKPENTVVLGARSWESGERQLLKRLGVVMIETPEIVSSGMSASLDKAYRIASNNTSHFGVSIDLDVFDPVFAPGVCSKEHTGLNPVEFIKALKDTKIFNDKKLCGLEIVEFAPSEDIDNKTLNILIDIIKAL